VNCIEKHKIIRLENGEPFRVPEKWKSPIDIYSARAYRDVAYACGWYPYTDRGYQKLKLQIDNLQIALERTENE